VGTLIQWRKAGEPVKPGLSVWAFSRRETSIGFVLSLDRWHVYCRYSKFRKKLFWSCERTEPRAWRQLKAKIERDY
jgi:hypothetical protein